MASKLRGEEAGEAVMCDRWRVPLSFDDYVHKEGPFYLYSVGDYVRNRARTETGEIVAVDRGYAWVRVTDKKRVSIALSDLEPAPKPLAVGDWVLWQYPHGTMRVYELLAIDGGVAFVKWQNGPASEYYMPALVNLERA